MDRAVAITGMGMVTAQGAGVEASWRGALEGRDVLRPWTAAGGIPSLEKIRVAQCPELARLADLPARLWKKLSRTQQLACAAVDEALQRAALPSRLGAIRAGVFLATTVCGMDQNEQFYAQYRMEKDSADVDLMRRLMPCEVGALIARRHDAEPSLCQVCLTTCVGSAMAIANAADAILQGQCDVAIAGGAEALCRVVLSGFNALKVASTEGCRPFDLNRPGMTVGEGSGILILERAEHAVARGAAPLAWLRGVGITCDAHHLTAPEPSGKQATAAIRDALRRAGIDPAEIDYINAHGTGTRDNDAMESHALVTLFEEAGLPVPPVSSTKRCTGHTFGAAAAIETIFCIQSLREGDLPPNAGSQTPDPCCSIPVLRDRAGRVDNPAVALCTNFAFGGNNTAIIVSRHAPTRAVSPPPATGLRAHGIGVVSDAYESVRALAASRQVEIPSLKAAEILDPAVVGQQDTLAQLVIRAAHQAWTMAALPAFDSQRIALLFVSAWGTIDATVAYLDSMFDAQGRYASPRHFSRSVYSSIASVTAIHFGIRGAVETLTFPQRPVEAAIEQAQRILAAGRADRVLIVWAEQAAPIAQDLCRRAVEKLGRHEYARFIEELGFGAVTLVLGPGNGPLNVPADDREVEGKPFMMKQAVALAAEMLQHLRAN